MVGTSAYALHGRRDSPAECDDFYEHACRKWKSENPIPKGRSHWSKWKQAEQQLAEEVSDFLLTSTGLSQLERQAKIMYATCLLSMHRTDCRTLSPFECYMFSDRVSYDTPFDAAQLSNSSAEAKQECLTRVSLYIRGAIESVYLRLSSPRATVDDDAVQRVFSDVREAALNELLSLRWLDAATKHILVLKLSTIRFYGRRAFAERAAIANACYSSLDLKWNSSTGDQRRQTHADRFLLCWSWKPLNPFIGSSSLYTSLRANAEYSPEMNYVAVYPAFLHQEALENARSRRQDRFVEVLYGTLGFVLAHEVAHAIGVTNGSEGDWMPAGSSRVFREKQVCLERWFSSKPIPGTNDTLFVNGTRTLGENMADLDGLKFASKALDIRRKRLGLPAVSKQEFFKSFAEMACENVTPSRAEHLAAWDEHSPWTVRINEVLRNNAEFAASYGCAQESPMNPAQKCSIWADEPVQRA